ncbi:hypothetical protein DPEC_G00016620 [Dallia pectoralis]|uniref:Uncharacterized protein n=1 Tax=Dallia pectoralis TaxID=75939 RepID=A0ACC2HNB4_DALPE|nr:hypothetical protein DPEC_G00016620 [Dallia pectoralis]
MSEDVSVLVPPISAAPHLSGVYIRDRQLTVSMHYRLKRLTGAVASVYISPRPVDSPGIQHSEREDMQPCNNHPAAVRLSVSSAAAFPLLGLALWDQPCGSVFPLPRRFLCCCVSSAGFGAV